MFAHMVRRYVCMCIWGVTVTFMAFGCATDVTHVMLSCYILQLSVYLLYYQSSILSYIVGLSVFDTPKFDMHILTIPTYHRP